MLILGKLIEWAGAKMLVPALLFAVAAFTGWAVRQNRAQAIQQAEAHGKQVCEQGWELALERQRRMTSDALAAAAEKQLNATELLNTELKSDVARISSELETYRGALAGADQRCLSERVRELARGAEGAGGRDEAGESGSVKPVGRTKAAKPSR